MAFEAGTRLGPYEIVAPLGSGGMGDVPFPNVQTGRWQISTAGGTQPLWSPDGRELFYRAVALPELMAVPVQTVPAFSAGRPQRLFPTTGLVGGPGHQYDISPDGKRFIFIKENNAIGGQSQIVTVINWFEEIKGRGK